ncbi:MAG: serine/threonine-protein kinase, partial [Ignavibacteriaceae bacterium]
MIGKTILHYKILEKLGEGGMGVVYLAEDTKLERKVAIKFLPKHISSDSEERARFKIEAKAAAALNHPNIATIHSIEEADEQMFIVMEYVKGKELVDFVNKNQGEPLPFNDIINYTIQIAEGLSAAHKEGIIHRDIKSSNIMITNDGKIKIMDFGLAKLRGKTKLTKIGTTIGTIEYMSPEQAQGEEVDQRADIWSFGIVLYEMLTGKMPFRGEYDQAVLYSILNEDPEPVNVLNPEVSPELVQITEKALQKNLETRYASMSEILNELEIYRDKIKVETRDVLSLRMLVHRLKRPRVFISAFGILILIVIVTWWFFNRQSKINWATDKALPQIKKLVDHSWRDFTEAYKLEVQAEKYIPGNPELVELISKSSLKININSSPVGAKVYIKKYSQPEDHWNYLGITPLKKIRLPIGIFRWKFEKAGFDTIFAASSTWDVSIGGDKPLVPYEITRKLDKHGSLPRNMVRVEGAKTDFGKVHDFFIDKY